MLASHRSLAFRWRHLNVCLLQRLGAVEQRRWREVSLGAWNHPKDWERTTLRSLQQLQLTESTSVHESGEAEDWVKNHVCDDNDVSRNKHKMASVHIVIHIDDSNVLIRN
jgi:hypothetical protein